jgi:hypothetical protein
MVKYFMVLPIYRRDTSLADRVVRNGNKLSLAMSTLLE